ncbi:Lrp/AsnC family transcriptional regulator [Cloacibacillus porcorum]|jgi:DNA-binding Lrp family transcriptional regulator|uniref:AsnC family transcriptional regulator n=1 Tax=Cloacibacillus porcorum TaxID=1197717 RepID=A0A1B2I386_9BACT|nr:Lrp/AsnC family transcriptional regulator [Cloacibacillus porcorum]ANZ44407.1 AsnC family transcriptional regulator [Cloacibacillus porcorum]MCC8185872.1 Lrp/AsnC family transcriptional regulator [Cloacibacillus porcorum]MCD8234879.1 Lrp/AsnC family transcriptional regulator [Cloacibacillus porcorum]MCI5864455.1 Lrp/AsnC family transcriptional regulator [Cloacibacillus porcorum]MDD7648949.1 Lrp/AsnC family transcriptional regulator [Cloacibacillus porcorum]
MDSKQREEILRLLEKNARYTAKDIAVMLGMDVSEVKNEIEMMEKERTICGYHALVDWDKTDDEKISALIELKVTPQRGEGFDRIAEKIYQYPEVESLYLMSGGYDFSVILKKATMKEIANFVSSRLAVIEEVQSTATHIVLVRYKDHGILLTAPKKDMRMVVTP